MPTTRFDFAAHKLGIPKSIGWFFTEGILKVRKLHDLVQQCTWPTNYTCPSDEAAVPIVIEVT